MAAKPNPVTRRKFLGLGGLAIAVIALRPFHSLAKSKNMKTEIHYDAIIIGGSYSGLAAAMALGRALKQVLIVDSGKPCNAQTPHSHNFLTQDGQTPAAIAKQAKSQVERYSNVGFRDGLAVTGRKIENGFEIGLESGETFQASKLIFATGITDVMPDIAGFAECWGISAIHCPYCHGYEVRNTPTGILGNGEQAFEFAKLISNWSKDLTVFTDGKSLLTAEHSALLGKHGIRVTDKEIARLVHTNGHISEIVFKDDTRLGIAALYSPRPFRQHCHIPEMLGCELTADGYIKTDILQETTVPGIYACGDNATKMRTVANAVAMGTTAGMSASKKMILAQFK